jgi:hypothetical protein
MTQLTAKLEQLRQDSAKAAADLLSTKTSAQAKAAPVENLYTQKTQDLAGLRSQREKARQDSIALVTKKNSRLTANKQETARMDAVIMAASNQLNALSARRQQLPVEETGGEIKAVVAIQRDMARADSVIRMKQADIAVVTKKREQLSQDSLSEESKASDVRAHVMIDGRRVDSLLQLSSSELSESTARQAKSRAGSGVLAQEQTKLNDCNRQKAVLDAQIARLRGELAALADERDRVRAASGASQKKLEQDRAPFVSALAEAEAKLQEQLDDKDALASLSEKVGLDSAIQKAKDALNSAIEQQALRKKGAEKLVNQREGEVSALMARLDDVVRKQPKVAQRNAQLSGLSTTTEKRKRIDSLMTASAAGIAGLLAQRDRAKRDLDEFDRTHPQGAAGSTRRLSMFDSLSAVKEKSVATLAARRDSVENQIASSQRSVESLGEAARSETASADSAVAAERKQRSDLMAQRAQIRADSVKNESILMVALVRLRTDQAKANTQVSQLDREIANLNGVKGRFTASIADAQNRDKQAKAANRQERKRLDSLISAKEQEVTQLSLQNEKQSQDFQTSSKESDALIQKQAALIASISSQIASAEQELSGMAHQVEASRKERSDEEKAGLDKIKTIERDKAATAASITAKKSEIVALKNQRESLQRGLKRQLAHLDSMITAAGKSNASYEAVRVKARQDSAAAEAAQAEARAKSSAALRTHDSLVAVRQQQMNDLAAALEKARQDSAAKSAPAAGGSAPVVKSLDSLIVLKERELADLRQQREKARQDLAAEQRRQLSIIAAAHQEVVARRALMEQKKAELAMMQAKRNRLQADSASAIARGQAASRAAIAEIARQTAFIAKKTDDLTALQGQRADVAAKLGALGADVPAPEIAPVPVSSSQSTAPSSAEAGQKRVEEIYQLIGSNKLDDAVKSFNAQRASLSKTVTPEAFTVLKYTIEQIEESQKKSKGKKR